MSSRRFVNSFMIYNTSMDFNLTESHCVQSLFKNPKHTEALYALISVDWCGALFIYVIIVTVIVSRTSVDYETPFPPVKIVISKIAVLIS